jgi:hypothetical protein
VDVDVLRPAGAASVAVRSNYLVDLFQGRLLSRVYCTECEGVSSTVDAMQGLELEVGRAATLEAALTEFCRSERLEARLGNAYCCDRCSALTSAEKCLRLSSVPDVLRIQVRAARLLSFSPPALELMIIIPPSSLFLVQLKRFCFDDSFSGNGTGTAGGGWGCRKLTHLVEFPLSLDMAPFTCEESASSAEIPHGFATPSKDHVAAQGPPGPLLYRLSAAIVHLGRSPDAGHYTAYVRHGADRQQPGYGGSWFLLDDEVVRRVPVAEVQAQQAYILLYERVVDRAGPCGVDDSPAEGTPASMLGRRLRAAVLSPPQSPFVDPSRGARADLYGIRHGSNPLCSPPFAQEAGSAEPAVPYHVALQHRRAELSPTEPPQSSAPKGLRDMGPSEPFPAPHAPLDTPMSAGKQSSKKSLFSLPHRRFLRSLNFFMRPADISGKRRRERDLQGLGHHLSNRHAPAHTPAAKTGPAYFSQQQYETRDERFGTEEVGAPQVDSGDGEEDGDSPSKRRKVNAADLERRSGGAATSRTSAPYVGQDQREKASTETSAGPWFLPFIPSIMKSLFTGGR